MGPAARARPSRDPARRVRRRDDRARAGARRRRRPASRPLDADVAAAPPRSARRPLRRGHARAAADLLQHVGGAGSPARPAPDRVGDATAGFDRRRTATASTSSSSASGCRSPQLLAEPHRGRTRTAPAGTTDEPTRIGRYARRLWDDLLAVEERSGCDGTAPVRRVRRRCRPASPCSRRAPAPARRSRSPPSPPATSPRARRSTRMLLVTFGRMATGELRARVRERLVTAEAGAAGRRRTASRRRPTTRCSRLLAAVPARRAGPPARRLAARPRRLRRGDDRHDARVLPAGAERARRRRRRRPRRHVRRGPRRPRRRGRRRPVPAQVRPPGDRPIGSRSPWPARSAATVVANPTPRSCRRRRPDAIRGGDAPAAGARRCATRSSGASGGCASSPTTTC